MAFAVPVPFTVMPAAVSSPLRRRSRGCLCPRQQPQPARAGPNQRFESSSSLPPSCFPLYAAGGLPRHNRAMRYQFVDCRWELGDPARGRELYLAGHIPGASFLDVDEDLSDLSVEDAGVTHCRAPSASRNPPRGPGSAQVSSWSRTGRWAAQSAVVAAAALRPRRPSPSSRADRRAGRARSARARSRSSRRSFEPQPRDGDTIERRRDRRRGLDDNGLVVVDARVERAGAARRTLIDKIPGRIPGAVNVPFTWTATCRRPSLLAAPEIVVYCGSGVTSCVTLHLAPGRGGPPGRQALPGLVERVGEGPLEAADFGRDAYG